MISPFISALLTVMGLCILLTELLSRPRIRLPDWLFVLAMVLLGTGIATAPIS